MLSRIATSFTLALLGIYGLTVPAFAAKGPDSDDVMLGTAATAAILMAIVGTLYALKWVTGLAEPAPVPASEVPHYASLPATGDGHAASAGGHH